MTGALDIRVAVIGLGYVGLPLAVAFGRVLPTMGFDIDGTRVRELQEGMDRNQDVQPAGLGSPYLSFIDEPRTLSTSNVFIVAVPTPVDSAKQPDLRPLDSACRLVGRVFRYKKETEDLRARPPVVVFESTVYPGCTEEACIPALEEESGLVAGKDFKVAYSPERINPGDAEHTLESIVKVVGGQDEATTEFVSALYSRVVKAGVHKAPSIRVAEAAKVIENIQRDLNIALINELTKLFHVLEVDTHAVLEAARTKWNFLPFEPGLVGGHCIPVDPYYLTHKAQEVGYHPEVILAGRRINDSMGVYIAQQTVRLLILVGKRVQGAKVLVLGATFKEDVPDVRNTRVIDLVRELENYGVEVGVYDPLVSGRELKRLALTEVGDPFCEEQLYDGVVIAVAHQAFRTKRPVELERLLAKPSSALVDVKGVFGDAVWKSDVLYWRL